MNNQTSAIPCDDELASYLDWHLEGGVTAILEPIAIDRFAESKIAAAAATVNSVATTAAPRSSTQPARSAKPSHALPVGTDVETIQAAHALAGAAQTLEALEQALASFDGCTLKRTAKSLVFGDGNPNGRVMFIGEAPGRDEDIQGKPFVGRSGQLLDRMLAAIELDRRQVFIANIVPWRPPGNRTPTPVEIAMCMPFLTRQIELCAPEFIIPLGGSASKSLLGTSAGILKIHGRWHDITIGNHNARALATLHPAYLLRSAIQKRLAWRDFQEIKRSLGPAASD